MKTRPVFAEDLRHLPGRDKKDLPEGRKRTPLSAGLYQV